LRERVAVPHRDRLVLERLIVDRERERRPDLILAPVAAADRAAVVVLGAVAAAELFVECARTPHHVLVAADEREHRRLHGRHQRVETEHGAVALRHHLLVVGVDEQRHEDPLDAHGRLDHVRDVALAALRVDVLELRRRVARVLGEVVVAAVRDALELRPADRVEVFDVARAARVVRALLGGVLANPEPAFAQAVSEVPAHPLVDPVAPPALRVPRRDEVLHLHLLELAHPEEEVAGRDLVAERLTHLRDAEGRLAPGELEHVLEVDEDALSRLGAEERTRRVVLHGAHVRLEHEVELARLGQVAVLGLARVPARAPAAGRAVELVGSKPELARAAVDQRVREPFDMARGFPDARVEDDGRVERDDVVALLDHRLEPGVPDVRLHEDAVVAVVVGRAEAAVDLGGGEDEPAPPAERHDLVHGGDTRGRVKLRHGAKR
jgi:hypothetical protein